MKTFLIIVVSALAGVIIGAGGSRRTIQKQRRTIRALRAQSSEPEKKRIETMKKVIWVCLINGFAWVWCSYILAWMDRVQIAESLSQVAVTEIIGVVLAYAIKSAIENLSKNNRWPDKGTDSGQGVTVPATAGAEAERTEPPDVGL